jgi:hypothetical protein
MDKDTSDSSERSQSDRLYYCDVWNGKCGSELKVILLLGPFRSEQQARENLNEVTTRALNLFPQLHFDYFFGTVSVSEDTHIEPMFRRDPDGLLELNPLAKRKERQEGADS